MSNRGWTWVLFGVTAVVAGLIYWWQADWWAYVEFPEGPMPKFTMPWWWQLAESGVVGAATGGFVVGAWAALRRLAGPWGR